MLREEIRHRWWLLMEHLEAEGSALQITAGTGELELWLRQFRVYSHVSVLVLSLPQLVFR